MTKNERKVNGCLLVLVVDGRKSVKKYINYSGVGVVVTLEFFFYNKICPIYKSDDDGTKKSLKSEFEKN